MSIDFGSLREQYSNNPLEAEDLGNNPFVAFQSWFKQALDDQIKEPNAMTLATVDHQGRPDARIVLLKEQVEDYFVFYTNYTSAKGGQMEHNDHVCLVFNWLAQERQIRIRGKISFQDKDKAEAYFQSRPRSSQVAAWSSPQSAKIEDRQVLETLIQETEKVFEGQDLLPLPPTWGGYKVAPYEIEFWQGRRSRLHDRLKYTLNKEGAWDIDRLAP
jgi:pyridoxamine 5'-phosphate oxidase